MFASLGGERTEKFLGSGDKDGKRIKRTQVQKEKVESEIQY